MHAPRETLGVVIPTAIVAGLILAVWIRWWAVPIVALGWAVVIAFADPSYAIGGALLGAVNGAVGVAFALVSRRVLDLSMRPRSNQPNTRD
jgi:hypothetical protein